MTILVTSDDGDGGDTSPSGETYGLASADDKGPVTIITEDPTCAAWVPINDTFTNVQRNGWDKRDPTIPASQWTPEQRAQYEAVGKAARNAADATVRLAEVTPHRVLKETYEQFIAYARAYSDAIQSYTPSDEHLARVVTATGGMIVYVCAAIDYGSAAARAPLVDAPPAPTTLPPLTDPDKPERFMVSPDSICADWDRILNQFNEDTKPWQALDSSIPATEWTSEQRSIVDAVIPTMERFADRMDDLGRASSNPVVRDFATFAAQYRRAYAAALPTYTPADSFLTSTSRNAASSIYEACNAVGA
ncbi:hypothetical protein [Mycobacterium sp. IS-3022]|uniref:hypothetical protein n=1 Tax=Mycobacterium sp. IS-3022 TaxID=1772277 RepID=UPI002570ADEC|nr:hypothetical protein [Mycobacterium sp. IS-3022]